MKPAILFSVLLLIGCTSSLNDEESTPKTRTVFFGTATLEKTGREVRVMLDTLDTRLMGLMFDIELRHEVQPSITWLKPGVVHVLEAPFYNVFWDYACGGLRFNYADQDWGTTYNEADFSQQEKITGQHIDMVIGHDDARRMFSPKDPQENYWWADMVGGDGRSLLEYHTDMKMIVPYDWGTSH